MNTIGYYVAAPSQMNPERILGQPSTITGQNSFSTYTSGDINTCAHTVTTSQPVLEFDFFEPELKFTSVTITRVLKAYWDDAVIYLDNDPNKLCGTVTNPDFTNRVATITCASTAIGRTLMIKSTCGSCTFAVCDLSAMVTRRTVERKDIKNTDEIDMFVVGPERKLLTLTDLDNIPS